MNINWWSFCTTYKTEFTLHDCHVEKKKENENKKKAANQGADEYDRIAQLDYMYLAFKTGQVWSYQAI